jgi:hypothetical protein
MQARREAPAEQVHHPLELEERVASQEKELEEELKEQIPLPILLQKKEVLVVLPQQVLERVPQELGEE